MRGILIEPGRLGRLGQVGFGKSFGQKGMTLLEMMAALAVLALIVGLAYPSFIDRLQRMEAKKAEATFKQGLRLARAYSHIHKKDVLLCTLDEHGACDRAGQGNLVLFHDNNNNSKKDAADTILWQAPWQLRHGEILLRVSAARHYIRYRGDSSRPRGYFGHWRYCSHAHNAELSFKVIINIQGNVRVEYGKVGC